MPSATESAIPVVDLSAIFTGGDLASQNKAVQSLSRTCHELGFVTIIGHGVADDLLDEAFEWTRKLFDLPYKEKMKAPHPKEAKPHRGYSAPGTEKGYSKAQAEDKEVLASGGEALDKIKDVRESYEIGSGDNAAQPNIWLPENVLPGYREFMTKFYWNLDKAAQLILRTLCRGLDLSEEEVSYVTNIHSGHNSQLRLAHYPAVSPEQLGEQQVQRLQAHTDWSSFTMLFQDSVGGLELLPASSSDEDAFIPATPVPYSCVLNIADMMERLSNGYYRSATHRVTTPMTRSRYSIPYFVSPDDDAVVKSLPTMLSNPHSVGYEPVTFKEYGAFRSKFQYERGKGSEMPPGPEGVKVR